MSNGVHFHLNGFTNKQKCRFGVSKNLKATHQRELHPINDTVWCSITADEIIGLYFNEDDNETTVTVTEERNRTMIENFTEQFKMDQIPVKWDNGSYYNRDNVVAEVMLWKQDSLSLRRC